MGAASAWQQPCRTAPNRSQPLAGDRGMLLVEQEQRANEIRSSSFDGLKLRNPLWDMLLALVGAKRSGRQLSMSDLCSMCDAPDSTALRLIHQLAAKGYAEMVPDRSDRRRTRVLLTVKGEQQFEAYLGAIEGH